MSSHSKHYCPSDGRKIDSFRIYTKHLIKFINKRFHVAVNKNYLVIVASNRPGRRLCTLRWLSTWWSWWSDSHTLYLLLQLLMHIFNEIMLFLSVDFRWSMISVAVKNQVVVVVVIFVCIVFVFRCKRVEIRV